MWKPHISLTQKKVNNLNKNINLARQLGIKFRFVTNSDMVKAIVDFAQKENITHIIIGKPRVRNLFTLLRLGNFVNRLIRYSGNIDVYILGSDIQSKDKFKEKVSLAILHFKYQAIFNCFINYYSYCCNLFFY